MLLPLLPHMQRSYWARFHDRIQKVFRYIQTRSLSTHVVLYKKLRFISLTLPRTFHQGSLISNSMLVRV